MRQLPAQKNQQKVYPVLRFLMVDVCEKNDERQLLEETLNGNSSAFRPLVERYWGLVYSIIRKYVKNDETTADLSQEVFLIAFTKLNQFQFDYRFSPWLARIAVNKALEFLRREKRSPVVDYDPEMSECRRFSPDQVFEQREFFDECLEKLPADMQIVFILRHGLDFSYEDIAHVMNQPIGTVKGALFRIRNQLKRIFEAAPKQEASLVCEGSEFDEK